MNNARRKMIDDVVNRMKTDQVTIESIKNEEELCKDMMPENLQNSVRYDRYDEIIDGLDEVIDLMDECMEILQDCK